MSEMTAGTISVYKRPISDNSFATWLAAYLDSRERGPHGDRDCWLGPAETNSTLPGPS